MENLLEATAKAVTFLCGAQKKDGLFVDFEPTSGRLDVWVTGVTVVALADAAALASPSMGTAAVRRAATALIALLSSTGNDRRPRDGWDGISMALAVRAILRGSNLQPTVAEEWLAPYISQAGYGQTNRFGRQTDPAAVSDATPAIGLALWEAGVGGELRCRVLAAAQEARGLDGQWHTRRWLRPCYTTWLNLEFLNAERALTPGVSRAALAAMRRLSGDLSVLDLASILGIMREASRAGTEPVPAWVVEHLLLCQRPDGSWPSSPALLRQPERAPEDPPELCADLKRLFTTAAALRALTHWHLATDGTASVTRMPQPAEN